MIFYLLYWGVESHKMDDAELEGLLLQARERNFKLGITGSLFYCEGTFIQLLEGEEENVREVFRSIGNDNRLVASKLVSQGYADQRYFGEWSMYYQEINAESIAQFEGYPVAEVSSYLKNAPSIKLLKLLTRKKTDGN